MNPLYPHPVSTLFSVISLFQSSTPLSPHLPSSLEGRRALGTITFPGTLFTTYRVLARLLSQLDSAWRERLFPDWLLSDSSSSPPSLTPHTIFCFFVFQIHPISVYQTPIIAIPTSWRLPCSRITCIIFRLLFFFQLIAFLTKIKSFPMKHCINAVNGKLRSVAIMKIEL